MNNQYSTFPFSILLILLIALTNFAKATDVTTSTTPKSIVVSYWGTLNNNPGIKLGLEDTRAFTSKYEVHRSIALLVSRKPNIYTSSGIILNSSLRRICKSGLYFEHSLHLGYLGSYYDFDFYRTNSNNELVNMGRKWVSSVLLGYSLGLGYDFAQKTKTNMQIFIKPGIYNRVPNYDNIYYLNNYSIEAGLSFQPKWAILKK